MKLNFTLKILLVLSIITSRNIYSQKTSIIKIGDIVYNQNIKIKNDSIDSYYYFTKEGICYGIKCKYKNTDQNDLERIQNMLSGNWTKNINGSNKTEDGYVAFDKYLCQTTQGNYFYRLGFDYLDVDEKGIVLIGNFIGIENSGLNPSRTEKSFKNLDDFLTNPEVLGTQKELKKLAEERQKIIELEKVEKAKKISENEIKQQIYDSTPIGEIVLPYSLYFNLSEIELLNKLKLIFSDKLLITKKHPSNNFGTNFGTNSTSYIIKDKTGKLELTIVANFYKNKVYSYQYYHEERNLENQLRQKNEDLIFNYNKIYGHDTIFNEKQEYIGKIEGVDYIPSWNLNDSKISLNEIAISEIKELIFNAEVKFNAEQEKLKEAKSIGTKM